MTLQPEALTCLADSRLRLLCSILLRHAGYRVLEATSPAAVRATLQGRTVSLIIAGALADPAEELTPLAREEGIAYVRLAPDLSIEALLELVEITALDAQRLLDD